MNAIYENMVIRPAVANFAESLVGSALEGSVDDVHAELEQFYCFILNELTTARNNGRMSAVAGSTN